MSSNTFKQIEQREQGLQRGLSAGQMSMIAIGGAIGTGLFMGSAFAINFAGPAVLLSYAIGALITLFLMGCLAEMTVAHSTSGSFGAYAETYINPLAGFLVRYSYWAAIVLAVGTEVTAVSKYMMFWFPDVPGWIWILGFSSLLVTVNAVSVNTFGAVEYFFSSIKVFAIIVFIGLAGYLLFASGNPNYQVANLTQHGGFFPKGLSGMWIAVIIAIFSYLSVEMIAVAAAEASNPKQAVKQAFKATVVRLVLFYLLTLFLMLCIVPWTSIGQTESPFVYVMRMTGIPGAAGIINAVILIAALSAMNSQLYITTRMMFSLSRGGYAPKALGTLNKRKVPFNALMLSSLGIAIATVLNAFFPDDSFVFMMGIAMYGALFTWMMIFVTHLFFRRHMAQTQQKLEFKLIGFPFTTLLGFVLIVAVTLSTAFVPAFQMTLVFGIPFTFILSIAYFLFIRKNGQ